MEEDLENMSEPQTKADRLRKTKIYLMYKRDEMEQRAATIMKDRAMHRERREREALEKEASEAREKGSRRLYDLGGEDLYKIDEERDEELRKAKNRLMILNTPEIQDLRKQVEVAYVRQQLETQIEQKKSRLLTEKQSERDQFHNLLKREAEDEEAIHQKEIDKKTKYRHQLQDQIISKYRQKQIDYKKFLKERALLEDSMRVVLEEDQLEAIREKLKRDKYKQEIENFHKARALWTLREKETQERQDEKRVEFIKSKEQFEQECKEKEKLKNMSLNMKRRLVYESLGKIQDDIEERQNALILKYEQEAERKAQEKETAEWLKSQRMKKELIDSFAKSLEDKLERLRREKLEDEAYMKEKLGNYQEDKKCLEMTEQKRRRLKMAYKSVILREIEERKLRRKLEEEELLKIKEQEDLKKKELKKLINEERLKILKEHSEKLIGFLPVGTLDPEDLPHMPQNVQDYYSPKPDAIYQKSEQGDEQIVKDDKDPGKDHLGNVRNEITVALNDNQPVGPTEPYQKETVQNHNNIKTPAEINQDKKCFS